MTFRDLIDLSVGNLWRSKLRAVLTISGVVIAIAAFVSMVSFGAGNQKFFTDAFEDLGLFTTMKVYPKTAEESDTTTYPPLDRKAIARIIDIPGVKMAYPFVEFEVTLQALDAQINTEARALSGSAADMRVFSKILGGTAFSADSSKEAIVMPSIAEKLGIRSADTLLGRQVVVSVQAASLDSGLISVLAGEDSAIVQRLRSIRLDSLYVPSYRQRLLRQEISYGLRRFLDGLMNRRITVAETLTVVGIGKDFPSYRTGMPPVIIPEQVARMFNSTGYVIGGNPADMFTAMRSGTFFDPVTAQDSMSYPMVTVDIETFASHKAISDSIEALGFRSFSFAEQFEDMQRFFLYYQVGLGIIGLIALVTAALGIVNTMVMSIMERRREIGVIKSLGADERDIKTLFIVESGVMGATGAAIGIVIGWVATRIVSAIVQQIMLREEIPPFDPFDLTLWIILIAFIFGVLVSTLAGFYPASRAAKVDPVEALRAE
jgi:ABC-type antimicrobial peptide transport system permease subunit